MSFTLSKVIFGLTWDDTFKAALKDGENPEKFGFTKLQAAFSPKFVGYLGVELGTLHGSKIEVVKLKDFKPTPEQRAEVQEKLRLLPPHMQINLEQVTTWVIHYN